MNYSSYIFNWSSHKFLFFFLQENNYKTLNHFYNTLWKQKPLIWVLIWTVCAGHSDCSSASLPACSSSSSGGIICFNLTISQFIETSHFLLSSHVPQKRSQTHSTPPCPNLMLGSHSSNSFRHPKLSHMAVLEVDQTSLVHVMGNTV